MHSLQIVQWNGVRKMELIKGNLLIFLTALSAALFILLWSKLYNGPFQQAFSFYRKKNMQQEWKLMGILIGSIRIICILLYYAFCILLHHKGVPVPYMAFAILTLFCCYLFISGSVIKNTPLQLVIVIFLTILAPFILVNCIIFYEVQLDRYCGYYSISLCIIDAILTKKILRYWKEGDF